MKELIKLDVILMRVEAKLKCVLTAKSVSNQSVVSPTNSSATTAPAAPASALRAWRRPWPPSRSP